MKYFDSTTKENPLLSDVLEAHLQECRRCRPEKRAPIPNLNPGGGSSLCSEWFEIIRQYAVFEGVVNNVVAHDEFGNEAGV